MKPLKDIRSDLKDVKYYYSRKKTIDEAMQVTGWNEIASKVQQYNDLMKTASPRMYDLYVSLYIKNHTQESYSLELGVTEEYVQRLNNQLLKFLQSKMAA